MRILLADDEQLALENLEELVREAAPGAFVHSFRKVKELLAFVRTTPCDIAFLDIEMRGMNGIALAKKLKETAPGINIIFVTGYSRYMGDAFGLHASGYLLKPATYEAVLGELMNLRNPVIKESESSRVRIQTFGNFEAFSGNEIIYFGRAKAKELFAYLVDRRGAAATMAEISSVLWENQEYSRSQLSQIHTFIAEIRNALSHAGHRDVLVKKRNSVAINVEAVDCDYYRFLQGDIRAINSFTGEYMNNYSWAEFTVGSLSLISARQRTIIKPAGGSEFLKTL